LALAVVGRGFVNAYSSTVELNVVHRRDGGISLGVLGESHKAKATAASSITVFNHNSFFDLTELLELGSQSGIVRMPCKASNE